CSFHVLYIIAPSTCIRKTSSKQIAPPRPPPKETKADHLSSLPPKQLQSQIHRQDRIFCDFLRTPVDCHRRRMFARFVRSQHVDFILEHLRVKDASHSLDGHASGRTTNASNARMLAVAMLSWGSNRTSCKACRYRRCVSVGMSPLS
ncbi:hypothetical protein V3C99_005699, partial [Haemonchus contortus]